MNGPDQIVPHESRWSPALAILVVLLMLRALPAHIQVLPVWVSYLAALAVLTPMVGVALSPGNTVWLRVERMMIILVAVVYVANVTAELADMIGVVTLHPASANAFTLLSSAVAIWLVNVLTSSLLFWQIDRGGPYARACKLKVRPDWVFPQASIG